MTIIVTKKLFLMTVLGLVGLQLSASEKNSSLANAQKMLEFITNMKQNNDLIIQKAADWMSQVFLTTDSYHNNITKKLISIINTDTTLEGKITLILQLKANSEKEINEMKKLDKKAAFLSKIGLSAGALSAFMITIGILTNIYYTYQRYKMTSTWS